MNESKLVSKTEVAFVLAVGDWIFDDERRDVLSAAAD